MKLIIREYLASLKERGELDAILPDLLSELGYHVYSRPDRGTTQHGVDVAAIGVDDDGEEKLFLFSIKQGDLTRQDWDGTPQALRSSLNEIQDVYIATKISAELQHLKVVICLCFGGDIREQVRLSVTQYINQRTTDRLSFREWNGDKISDLILRGLLREELLPRELRSHFQKSIAMTDEPDVSYYHFNTLVKRLTKVAIQSEANGATVTRQLYICLWILFVWARDNDNLEAPYRVSELILLAVWDILRPYIGRDNKNTRAINSVLAQLIQLHVIICSALLETKIIPHVCKRDGISLAIPTRTPADVNLTLFDFLGRLAMTGHWIYWLATRSDDGHRESLHKAAEDSTGQCFKFIQNNRALFLPLCDRHAVEISLLLLLAVYSGGDRERRDAIAWLTEMAHLLDLSVRTHGRYPTVFTDYADLIEHPRERTDGYREEATSGSILIPLVAAWLLAAEEFQSLNMLVELKNGPLNHCTLQLWVPDAATDDAIYKGGRGHGVAVCDLPLTAGNDLLETISDACKREATFHELSAIKTGYWPILLLACRHFQMPVPPHFWVDILHASGPTSQDCS